jgi:hypothetical protein
LEIVSNSIGQKKVVAGMEKDSNEIQYHNESLKNFRKLNEQTIIELFQ